MYMWLLQALNFALEGAQQFSPGKGHFYEENVNLYLNFAKGITAKAQGTHGNCCGCRGLIRGLPRTNFSHTKYGG